jgi:predicted exporter
VAAVIGVIVVFYRWWRSVVVLVVPLLLATVYSFALASLPPFDVTELNSNTAFLGSIIVGNGINFGIILLGCYVEERRAGSDVEPALAAAVRLARPGTMSAALAASASYAALVLTEFRGFHQFGVIGGIGMLMAWLVAYVLMPPLVAWLDHSPRTAPGPKPAGITARLGSALPRIALPVTIATVLLATAAAWEAHRFDSSGLEYDMSKLRRRDTWETGEGYWGRRMDAVLGQYLTPTVILADSREQAKALGVAARDRLSDPTFARMVSTIRTADDILPPDQDAKVAITRAIRRDLSPKIRSLLSPKAAKEVDRLLGVGPLEPVTLADLPSTFTEAMVERDGSFGRTVLVYPKPGNALWAGEPLVQFVGTLRSIASTPLPMSLSGVDHAPAKPETWRPARVAGSLPLSADIIASIVRDGPRASFLAFVGVIVVVIAIFRARWATVYVLLSLLIAVLYLFAGAMVLGVKINFSNFIAFPITFGIGVDYAVNIVSRYTQDGEEDAAAAVRSIGGAVALCSLTTILGYSSLLLAENRALHLFGLLAVLGEIACLSTALIALPSALIVLRRCRFDRARSSIG